MAGSARFSLHGTADTVRGCYPFFTPKPLQKKLPKFAPNAVPGVFLGWHLQPGGVWTGEYLVAYWPDFQAMGIDKPGRVAVHCVQEVILEELPNSAPRVGDWSFPMAVQFNDATWSLPPSARSAVESTDPSHQPDPEAPEAEVQNALEPWVEGPVPDGLVPPPDQMPLLDYPFIYHGGSGSKAPSRSVLRDG